LLFTARKFLLASIIRLVLRTDFTNRGITLAFGCRLAGHVLSKTARLLLLPSNRLRFGDLSLRTDSAFTLHFHQQFGMQNAAFACAMLRRAARVTGENPRYNQSNRGRCYCL